MTNEPLFSDLDDEEQETLREVFSEFRDFVEGKGWLQSAKNETKRRVQSKRQDTLKAEYKKEVEKLTNLEAKLKLRDEYRKRGLDI